MSIAEEFNKAVYRTKQLKRRPSNQELLLLYALYKQATEGDIPDGPAPERDIKAIAKFNAWKAQKGKSRKEAMKEYVNLVQSLE